MEPAGLAVGVLALAGLFNNAVQCFEYIQLGRGFGSKFQTCQLRLDCAQLRLSRWGRSLGLDVAQPQQTLPDFPGSPEEVKLAEGLLGQILDLFEIAEFRSSQFKKRASPDDDTLATYDSQTDLEPTFGFIHRVMRKLAIDTQKQATLKEKTKWALYEENALGRLIEDITKHVEDLINLFPTAKPRQQELCKAEVSEIEVHEAGARVLREIAAQQDKLLETMLMKSGNNSAQPQPAISAVFSGSNNKGVQLASNSGTYTMGNMTFGKD
ncbi:hypothetical protein MGYG_00104 [Nannizzia gypsea CBS 118893]|uniref:Uncharacterized protein n=1 Tax=Arthroderma gypseum (strain ATCC MYA-4604 / CBS 118893) TaxID=535722 RepID=E5R2S6_ARTGP|nr:hypothetical protein MGYG_00104 [Nannizzia gypsea CBS 118893]EFQ97060.1 hypothetical protein MGYG_00104 [Nannizzia gypsea CBS 118893]